MRLPLSRACVAACFGALALLASSSVSGAPVAASPAPNPPTVPGPKAAAASTFLAKPVTVVRPVISAAEKQSVGVALQEAQRGFLKDGDKVKLTTAPSTLTPDARRLYRAQARSYLTAQSQPRVTRTERPSISGGATYAIVSGVVSGYLDVDCEVSWTVDFVITNRGVAALSPPPSADLGPWFADSNNGWTFMGSTRITDALARGATAPLRHTFKRRMAHSRGMSRTDDCSLPLHPTLSMDLGGATFYSYFPSNLKAVRYELYLENGAFFVAEFDE